MGNGTTTQLGPAIPQTLDDNNGTEVVQESNLGPAIPQTLDIPIDGAEDIPGYIDQIVQNFGKRINEQKDITGDWKRGEMDTNTGWEAFDDWAGDWIHNIQSFGKTGAGTVFDLIGVGIGATIDGISLAVPDAVEEPIKQQVADSWDWLMNTEGGQEAAEAFEGGVGKYKAWKEDNPQAARTFESLVNVALVFAPVKVRAKVGPVQGPSIITKGPSEKLISSGLKSESKTRYSAFERMLAPKITKDTSKNLGAGGESIITPNTLFKGPTLGATTSEREVLEYLTNLRVKPNGKYAINPNKSVSRAKVVVDKSQIKLNDEIGKILTQHSDKKIILQNVDEAMKVNVGKALEDLISLKKDKQIITTVEDYVSAANAILKKNGNTPLGIHKSRIEFDALMKSEVGKKVLTPEATGLNSIVSKAIRDAMNASIDAVIPLKAVKVRRKQQNLNYRAIEMIAAKLPEEGAKLAGFFQNILRVNKSRATMASAVVLTGGSLYGSKILAGVALSLGTIVSFAGLSALLAKGTLSPKTRKALGVILREGDKAIQTTVNGEMKKHLLTGKVLVSDLLQMPTENVDAAENPL